MSEEESKKDWFSDGFRVGDPIRFVLGGTDPVLTQVEEVYSTANTIDIATTKAPKTRPRWDLETKELPHLVGQIYEGTELAWDESFGIPAGKFTVHAGGPDRLRSNEVKCWGVFEPANPNTKPVVAWDKAPSPAEEIKELSVSDGIKLDVYGVSRGLHRKPGEDDESYRNRITVEVWSNIYDKWANMSVGFDPYAMTREERDQLAQFDVSQVQDMTIAEKSLSTQELIEELRTQIYDLEKAGELIEAKAVRAQLEELKASK